MAAAHLAAEFIPGCDPAEAASDEHPAAAVEAPGDGAQGEAPSLVTQGVVAAGAGQRPLSDGDGSAEAGDGGRGSEPSPPAGGPPEPILRANFSALRFRKSCYFGATVRWGVKGFTAYNHMLLPIAFSSPEEEYECLCNAVCLWDVAAQRQVELLGADALKLAEMLTPRPLGSMKVGECRYAMVTDEAGMVLNDPVVLKLAEDRYWFSLADSDLLFWIKSIAIAHGLEVSVAEPAVSPLAVQGPKSLALMRDLFGEWVDGLKFYRFQEAQLDGIPMLVARSGWSPELGYELYLQDDSRGDELWERIMAAGQRYDIKPGAPNQIRRLEGGLLSYGTDVTNGHNVLELGLPPKWTSPDKAADFVGKEALKRLLAEGAPQRLVVGLEFFGAAAGTGPGPLLKQWAVRTAGSSDVIGFVTSTCYSPALGAHLAIATLAVEASAPGTVVAVDTPCGGPKEAAVRKLPFMPRRA